nr:unnamed protein product [Callosobruchus chinensis]
MVIETNRNAQQVIENTASRKSNSRLSCWRPVTVPEMRKFLGIILYMGLVHYPSIETYWATNPIYKITSYQKYCQETVFNSCFAFGIFRITKIR